jgi:hypothetical protein
MRGLAEREPRGYPCGGPAEALPVFGQGLIGGPITGVTGKQNRANPEGPAGALHVPRSRP